MKTYKVLYANAALNDYASISDRRIQKQIRSRLERLETNPVEQADKSLSGSLKGHYSLRIAQQRYRAIYKVIETEDFVIIEVIQIRKEGDKNDAYKVAKKRLS